MAQGLFAVRLVGPGPLLAGAPLLEYDYALHLATATLARQTFWESGRLWGYSPYHMAGYPMGTADAVSNRVGQLAVALLRPLPAAQAFAWTLVALLALLPWTGYATLRLAGRGPPSALLAALLVAAMTWGFLDPPRPYLHTGMYAHVVAIALAPLAVVALLRLVRRPRWSTAWAAGLALAAGATAHLLFPLLVLPSLVAIALPPPARRRRRLAAPLTLALALPALTAAYCAWPLLAVAGQLRPTAPFLQGTLAALGGELASPRALLWLGAAAGAAGLWRGGRRRAAAALGGGALGCLALGGFGELLPALAPLEPARFLDAATLFSIPLAVEGAARASRHRLARTLVAAALAALLLLPLWAWWRTVGGEERLLALTGEPSGDGRLQQDTLDLVAVLRSQTEPGWRILIEAAGRDTLGNAYGDTHLLALLPFLIDRELIGGPLEETRLVHHHVDFVAGELLGQPLHAFSDAELDEALRFLRVGWVVAWSQAALADLAARPALARLRELGRFRIFVARGGPPPLAPAIEARLGSLEVAAGAGGWVVLPYHWTAAVRTQPPLPVRRAGWGDDPVGFVAVEAPGGRFRVLLD